MSHYVYERLTPERSRSVESDGGHKKSPLLRPRESRVGKCTKAWTLEEERVLLQCRMERIPYKHIATRLGKTDLACRLHYHQMVMAKRGPETQPGRSIVFLSSEHPPEVHRLTPASSGVGSLDNPYNNPAHVSSYSSDRYSLTPRSDAHQHRAASVPGLSSDYFQHRNPSSSLNSSTATSPQYHQYRRDRINSRSIDMSRLQDLYREHASEFWSSIAAAYSVKDQQSLAPTDLESAFLSVASNNSNGGNSKPNGDQDHGQRSSLHLLPPPRQHSPLPSLGSSPSPSSHSISSMASSWHERNLPAQHQGLPHPLRGYSKCSVESLLNRPTHSSVI